MKVYFLLTSQLIQEGSEASAPWNHPENQASFIYRFPYSQVLKILGESIAHGKQNLKNKKQRNT